MTAKEAIASLKTLCHTCEMFPKCVNDKPECFQAIELAISALEAQGKQSWIPVKGHYATDDEIKEHPDIAYWFDCMMPNDDEEILISVRYKNHSTVYKDVCYVDDGYHLDSGFDWITDVTAWCKLPEPYQEESV